MDEQSPPTQAERREEIKLRLEYVKVVVSFVTIGSILFAALQWKDSNNLANNTIYQRMSSEWSQHVGLFITQPQLRPYFFNRKPLSVAPDDHTKNIILGVADVRLNAIDAILTFAADRWTEEETLGWRRTFLAAFKNSPVLCARIRETWDEYGLSRPIATEGCKEYWR